MRYPLLLGALAALVALLSCVSLLIGPAAIGWRESLVALLRGGADRDAVALVMQEVRLPRMLLAALCGAALGLAGAALQGLTRNPLAEPGLIGTSASAALGAVIALQTGLAALHVLALPAFALLGAFAAALMIVALAGPRGGTLTMILAGVALSALAGALTALVLNLSPNPFAASEIVFWMMGSLADRSMAHVAISAPFVLVGGVLVLSAARALDALVLGEEAAASLGVNLARLRLLVVGGTAALVGGVTAVAGAVGFVGLVVPHLLRPLVAASPSRLLPASALGGAAMVLAADIAVRVIAPDRDLKLGVLTALVGTPFFLRLIWRMRGAGP